MKMIMIIFFLMIFTLCQAPDVNPLWVQSSDAINPYKRLIYAVGMVESSNNDSAINHAENSWGRFQVRQVRLDDYFRQTGIRYELPDMLDSAKAVRVFNFYAGQIGPYDFEQISRNWNAGPHGMKFKQTIKYWNQIKKHL